MSALFTAFSNVSDGLRTPNRQEQLKMIHVLIIICVCVFVRFQMPAISEMEKIQKNTSSVLSRQR